MGAAYLGTAPIFILEGPYGSCELWSDELGYLLYFEPSDADEYKAHPPIQVGKYANRSNVIEDAFEDAKDYCGLAYWKMDWFSINAHVELEDLEEWDSFLTSMNAILAE